MKRPIDRTKQQIYLRNAALLAVFAGEIAKRRQKTIFAVGVRGEPSFFIYVLNPIKYTDPTGEADNPVILSLRASYDKNLNSLNTAVNEAAEITVKINKNEIKMDALKGEMTKIKAEALIERTVKAITVLDAVAAFVEKNPSPLAEFFAEEMQPGHDISDFDIMELDDKNNAQIKELKAENKGLKYSLQVKTAEIASLKDQMDVIAGKIIEIQKETANE
jgi:hypothetical protein